MKVKSSNYHTSAASDGRTNNPKHPSQSIHQPVLSSSSNMQAGHSLMSSSLKDGSGKTGSKGGSSKAHGQKVGQQQEQEQELASGGYSHQGQAYYGQSSGANGTIVTMDSHCQQQQHLQSSLGHPSEQQQLIAHQQQENGENLPTPINEGKNQTKIVNLSFAGQEFEHRNMSTSMHNGFYVNAAAMEEASRKEQIAAQQQQQQEHLLHEQHAQQTAQLQELEQQSEQHSLTAHGTSNPNANHNSTQGQQSSSSAAYQAEQHQQHMELQQETAANGGEVYHEVGAVEQAAQQASQEPHQNSGSVRSLGIGQQRQQELGAGVNTSGAQVAGNGVGAQGNFSTMTENVISSLHHLQNTPAQKKNVSSKNQQRRKISATNQSAEFQTNGSQLLQSTISYPHTIKKKSSKAKMLVGGDGNSLSGQPMISAFQGGQPAPGNAGNNHHNSMSVTRTENGKLQQSGFKGTNRGPHPLDSDETPDASTNLFMHENRLANTLNRGQQSSVQSEHTESLAMSDNIFNVVQTIDGINQASAQGQNQQMYTANSMQGYIASKQLQGVQTPSGFKEVAIVQNSQGEESYAFFDGETGKYIAAAPGANSIRAKTMAPNIGGLQPLQPTGHHEVISSQHVMNSAQASAKMNKNYIKVAPQYDMVNEGGFAKSQQRSYQSLQAQQLSLLNEASNETQANGTHNGAAQVGSAEQQQQEMATQFAHSRKLVSMKNGGPTPDAQSINLTNLEHQISSDAASNPSYIQPVIGNSQKQVQEQMQPMYARMVPSNLISSSDGESLEGGPSGLPMQRTVSVQPHFESSDQQLQFEELQLNGRINSVNFSNTQKQSMQPLVLNQAQIQYVTSQEQHLHFQQQQHQQEEYLESQQMPQEQPEPPVTYEPPQSAQKNTNLIVRIDNSNAANHQITKRKRLKDGVPLRTGQNGQAGDPSDTDQISEASKQPTFALENVEQLPVFINKMAPGDAMEPGILVHQHVHQRDMANSAQNFNPNGLQGRISINQAADAGTEDGGVLLGPNGEILNKATSRNENLQEPCGKPNSAVLNKRVPLEPGGAGANGQAGGRPDSKQGSNQGMHISAKKKFDQELAARDALIGIDDEDELVAHHEDFSENEGESQRSGGTESNDELELHYNKSVDSDKLGKSGSLSFRQAANLKSSAAAAAAPPVGAAGVGENLGATQPQKQVGAPSGMAILNPSLEQQNNMSQQNVDSDTDSQMSGSQHHQFLQYNNSAEQNRADQSFNELASDSETDGNFSDTGSCFGRGTTMREDGAGGPGNPDGIDGISEHSSDEADSDSEEVLPDGKKKEKVQGEKPVKRKKKKNEDEKAATIKKSKGTDKDTTTANKKGGKEKQHAAPTKKNFTEAKEKEYNTKTKQKEAPKPKPAQQVKDQKNAKAEKNEDKQSKGTGDEPTKPKKPKPEESKGGAAAAADALKESPEKKKPKQQKLNLALVHTQPKNMDEQKEAFFDSGCTQNPVFEYENYAATQKFLAQFKEPSDEYLELSKEILDSFIEIYGSESAYLETEGEVVPKDETLQIFNDYNEDLGFEELLSVQFKQSQVAPTSVTHDPKTGKSRVNIRDPPEYRRGRLYGVIDHEIGTHFMRKFNERFEVWHKKRDKWEMKSCIQTEEGFACVNQLVRTAWDGKHPFLYRSALNYYSAFMASKMSFVELFNDIEKYIDAQQSRWKFVLRLKRGLIDTSEPGGLYKDQCYLEGAVQFLQNRHTIDIIGLFTGKISLEDLEKPKIQKVLNKESIKLPPFVKDMDRYMSALDIIARTNHIPPKPTE